MIYYTIYAEQKFDLLNKHKVFFTKEQIEDCIQLSEKNGKIGTYIYYEKENIKVICKKINNVIKVCTFYPIKK